jgi:hypothetical protein
LRACARQPGGVSPFFLLPHLSRCWYAYIGRGAARFACIIHVCFHYHAGENAGGQISQHAGNTHALQFFTIISFCMRVGVLESGICMCSRLVSTEGVHQPCSLSFYVQQISFHVGSLRFCFLSFSMPSSFHAGTLLRILGANVSLWCRVACECV